MVLTAKNSGSSFSVLASQFSASPSSGVFHGMGLSHGGRLYTKRQCFAHSMGPRFHVTLSSSSSSSSNTAAAIGDSVSGNTGTYKVGDFMTKKKDLLVVKSTTPVDEALETLVRRRISGLPVVDDDWNLVGVVSDYDLLALDSISGVCQNDTNMFPEVHRSWKAFHEIQRLLSKNHGQVVGDFMTSTPLVVVESTKLEQAARLLLETKFRRLPVVDGNGKLVGLITRGNIVRAALMIKRKSEGY